MRSAVPVQRHVSRAGDAERARRGLSEIDDAPAVERSAVVDAHHHRAPGALVHDPHPRAEGQRAMSRRHGVRVETLAIGGLAAVEACSIPRGGAALDPLAGGLSLERDGRKGARRERRRERQFQKIHSRIPFGLLCGLPCKVCGGNSGAKFSPSTYNPNTWDKNSQVSYFPVSRSSLLEWSMAWTKFDDGPSCAIIGPFLQKNRFYAPGAWKPLTSCPSAARPRGRAPGIRARPAGPGTRRNSCASRATR